jgi:hypothetical protein
MSGDRGLPLAHTIYAAAKTGFIGIETLSRVAEFVVGSHPGVPHAAVLDLAQARSLDDVYVALKDVLEKEQLEADDYIEFANCEIGFIHWLYVARALTLGDALNAMGLIAEGGLSDFDSETFYAMLSAIELDKNEVSAVTQKLKSKVANQTQIAAASVRKAMYVLTCKFEAIMSNSEFIRE